MRHAPVVLAIVFTPACSRTLSIPLLPFDPREADTLLSVLLPGGPAMLDPDGADPSDLLPWDAPWLYLAPALSPGGDRAAMCAAPADSATGALDTLVEGSTTGVPVTLATARQYCGSVAYSPSGDSVTWNEQDMDGEMHLRVSRIDGAAVAADDRVVASGLFSPQWVLGGEAVVALTSASSDLGPIVLVDLATGASRALESTLGWKELVASPDGGLLLTRSGYGLAVIDVASDTAWLAYEGGDEEDGCVAATPDLDRDCFVAPSSYTFSPDGRQVVFEATPQHGAETYPELRVLDVETGAIRVLAARGVYNDNPVFGADGDVYWVRDFEQIVRGDGSAEPSTVYEGEVYDMKVAWP